MRWPLAALLLVVVACNSKPVPAPEPVAAPSAQVVTDPETVKAAEKVLATPPEPINAKAKAAAKDPAMVLGEWAIRSMQSTIDGKVGSAEAPLVPGSWVLTQDGKYRKLGGNEIEGTIVFTGTAPAASA